MIPDPFEVIEGRGDLPPDFLLAMRENVGPADLADLLADLLGKWRVSTLQGIAGAAVVHGRSADRRALWRATAARLRKKKKISLAAAAPCARAVLADLRAAVERGKVDGAMLASERTIRRVIEAER